MDAYKSHLSSMVVTMQRAHPDSFEIESLIRRFNKDK